MAFLVNGSPIITQDRDLSAVGVATLTEDINIGRLLYDSTGQVGAANSVLVIGSHIVGGVEPECRVPCAQATASSAVDTMKKSQWCRRIVYLRFGPGLGPFGVDRA